MTIRFRLLGAPAIEAGGDSTAMPFERRSQLLALLALRRAWVGRAEIATLLWPDQELKLAYTNLRKILFRLQAVSYADRIETQGGALRFEVDTDVAQFEAALADERAADAHALALYRGDLLEGFDDDANDAWSGWLAFERDRLRALWRNAAVRHLAGDIVAADAIGLSARLLETDPLDEAALCAHMTWLARSGQGGRARTAYREFAARLAQDLGLDPGAELKALHDSLATRMGAAGPAPSAAVPAADGSFIGRSMELRQIAELLENDDCRLICIIGQGGVGKTRLAQRTLVERAPDFADGAAFVPLDDVALPAELGDRLAREIGVERTGSGEALDKVMAFLREREMLLVLDNFEQIVDAAPMLGRMLQACPAIKIVVTSRVRLSQPNEWLLPLEGLPCPELEDQDRVDAFDAARLFVRAAQRVDPDLVPSSEAAAIVDICRQVDGLPLALELAAAWTRVLSCEAIANELRHGTELLRAVDATRPSRHASIEVVFEQSWRLLTPVERDILGRLSVFRGGFTVEAARAVSGASFPVLGALADKSLLRKNDARLHLHPLVHQLTLERLDQSGARAETEKAHALYFHRVLAESRRAIEAGEREALRRVDTELENCRIAWRWAVANDASDALKKSTLSLFHFCDHRDRHEDCMALLAEASASGAASADAGLQALLLAAIAHFEYRLDRYADAMATATRALAAGRLVRDANTQTLALQVLGACNLRLGKLDDALAHFDKALQQAMAGSEPRKVAVMLANQALVHKSLGRYDEALRLSSEAHAQYRRVGDVAGEALTLNNLGVLYVVRKQYESASAQYKAGLSLCDRHGLTTTRALILANLTELAQKTNDRDAPVYAARALEHAVVSGNRALVGVLKIQFARFALEKRDLDAARRHLAESMEIALTIGRPSLQIEGLCFFAEVLAEQGEPGCARRVLAFAADDSTVSVPDREEIRARLELYPASPSVAPNLSLDLREMLHRIVVEAGIAYAPLIAILRAG